MVEELAFLFSLSPSLPFSLPPSPALSLRLRLSVFVLRVCVDSKLVGDLFPLLDAFSERDVRDDRRGLQR